MTRRDWGVHLFGLATLVLAALGMAFTLMVGSSPQWWAIAAVLANGATVAWPSEDVR